MNPGNVTARALLQRLLKGERGPIVLHLAMLLEKSSALAHEDEHYRAFLPLDLLDKKLDQGTVDDITHILCEEISRRPDADLMGVVAMTGATDVTRLALDLLTDPSRKLGEGECRQALGIVASFLQSELTENPKFLPDDMKRLLIAELAILRDSKDVSIRNHATRLATQLRL
jgi:hypothetical protein